MVAASFYEFGALDTFLCSKRRGCAQPELARAGWADEGSASFARDALRTSAHPAGCDTNKRRSKETMSIEKHHFIVDDKGNCTAIILDIAEYEKLMEEIEELEAIRAYDAAVVSGDEAIPFEQAANEIERSR